MENLIEYLQSDNVKLFKAFFEMKEIERANEHAQQEQRDAFIKANALDEYERKIQEIMVFYKKIVSQLNENNAFIYNNESRKVLR